jgi:hypothetical protein
MVVIQYLREKKKILAFQDLLDVFPANAGTRSLIVLFKKILKSCKLQP